MSVVVLFPFLLRIQSRIMFVFVCHISLAYDSSTFLSFHSPSQLFCELSSSWDLSGSFLVVIFCLFFSERVHCTVVLCAHCRLRSTEYRVSSHGWCWVGLLGKGSVLRISSCKGLLVDFLRIPNAKFLWAWSLYLSIHCVQKMVFVYSEETIWHSGTSNFETGTNTKELQGKSEQMKTT